MRIKNARTFVFDYVAVIREPTGGETGTPEQRKGGGAVKELRRNGNL